MKKTFILVIISIPIFLILTNSNNIKLKKHNAFKNLEIIFDSNEIINGKIFYKNKGLLWSVESINGRLISYTNYSYTIDSIPKYWLGVAYLQNAYDSIMTYKRFYEIVRNSENMVYDEPLYEVSDYRKTNFSVSYYKSGKRNIFYYYESGGNYNNYLKKIKITYYSNGNVKNLTKTDYHYEQKTDTIIKISVNGRIQKAIIVNQNDKQKFHTKSDIIGIVNNINNNFSDTILNKMKSKSIVINERCVVSPNK